MTTPIKRKLSYVNGLASPEGIDLSMLVLGNTLDLSYLSIGWNLLFSFYLDLTFQLDLHFDFSDLSFFYIDFSNLFNLPLPKVEKGRWGVSYYDNFIYDPPDITSKTIESFAWYVRKHTSETDVPSYKALGKSLKDYISNLKQLVKSKNVADFYVDAIEEKIAWAEGKAMNTSYWGFAIWGVSKWMAPAHSLPSYVQRDPADWLTETENQTVGVYESQWGRARWGYARWSGLELKPQQDLADSFKQRVVEFQQRLGTVTEYGQPVLHQRVFMLQRVDNYHKNGGYHQINLQKLLNDVKAILNRSGVTDVQRLGYLSFAEELYYLNYSGHRKYKQWRTILTEDDVVKKYLNMGFDPNILNKIRGVIGK